MTGDAVAAADRPFAAKNHHNPPMTCERYRDRVTLPPPIECNLPLTGANAEHVDAIAAIVAAIKKLRNIVLISVFKDK